MKKLETLFDEVTSTLTYIVYDDASKQAIVIDPVWDLDVAAGVLSETHHEKVKQFLASKNLNPILVMETHAHADHLSGAILMKRDYPEIKVAIGEFITKVQEVFAPVFNFKEFNTSGSQFDILLKEGELFEMGVFKVQVFHTPGHTPACSSYLIEDHLFTGDALFMPDSGTGRCDFPKGSAKDLYHSIQKLYQLPDETKVHPGHDYQPGGRELKFEANLGEHKKNNIQITAATTEAEYIEFRQTRDKTLNAPKLLYPSIQVNITAGRLPAQEDNQVSYLKIPLKL
ncbi:MAG: MBL fold metallo-hydrolase [Halobacteriovorax sp.]|nr:MBL fold metallo-hydrolase [Halobacteriovorax sp.]